MVAEQLARHRKARFTSSHSLFLRSGQHAAALGRAGRLDWNEEGKAIAGREIHKGKALAKSCEDAAGCNFVQEKMNKVNNEVGPALLVWES